MTPRSAILLTPFIVLLFDLPTGSVGEASAQVGPSQLPPANANKSESQGVAEQAQEDPDSLPTTPILPPVKGKQKRFELFELDGYYRFRTDWLKNFHLGFDSSSESGAPFPQALACLSQEDQGDDVELPCKDSLNSANMRLRLEPTIHLSERSRVHAQIDVLDNLVVGSTTVGTVVPGSSVTPNDVPISGFAQGQAAPTGTDAIAIKRAWAEVDTALGQLSFGRQPWHWGMGLFANAGGADPFSGNYDLDDDFGDTVDRLMFRARVPGTNIDAAVAMDWAATAPSAAQTGLYQSRVGGQPFDLDDNDDINQWVVMFTRFDGPKLFQERVARGEWVFNYGGLLVYRDQRWDVVPSSDDDDADQLAFQQRGLTTYTPDLWVKFAKGNLLVEAEAAMSFGSVDDVSDLDQNAMEAVDILRFGAAARVHYAALDGDLGFGFEVGTATGDGADNTPVGATHVANAPRLPPGEDTINVFRFDYDYDVDLILFQHLLGTVNNATYFKPTLSYQITEDFRAKLGAVISMANVSEATPGDDSLYGVEFNADLGYSRGGFFAGISYGILFPLGAMHHPDIAEFEGNVGDAGNAQIIKTQLALQF